MNVMTLVSFVTICFLNLQSQISSTEKIVVEMLVCELQLWLFQNGFCPIVANVCLCHYLVSCVSISNALQLVNGKIALSIAPVPRAKQMRHSISMYLGYVAYGTYNVAYGMQEQGQRGKSLLSKAVQQGGILLVKYQDVTILVYTLFDLGL